MDSQPTENSNNLQPQTRLKLNEDDLPAVTLENEIRPAHRPCLHFIIAPDIGIAF